MTRPAGATIAAFVCAALIGLLYVSPVLKHVARQGLDWPIWIDHPEGLIHTNYGKWWVLPPHHYLVDGSSGEFPIYYPSLSDSMINLVAEGLGIPAMTVQAVLFGPLLGGAFLLLNYFSLAAMLGDKRVALVASLILSLGGNSSFVDRLDSASGLPLNAVLHVPFHVISLATSQSLGWVLLLPTLSLSYLAYREASWTRALGAGVLLGALFHSHTLTFVNVAAAQLAFLVSRNALDRPRDLRFKAWLAALGLMAALFVGLVATRETLSFTTLVALGALALGATFLVDPSKRFYVWSYGAAGLVALPYLLLLATHAGPLGAMQDGWNQVQMMTVGLPGFLWFFAAYLLAAVLGWRFARDRSALPGIYALLVATAFLAVNHFWDWGNHPYRYAIHLLFPLTILGALGLRDAPRPLAVVLGVWLSAISGLNAWHFATGHTVTVHFRAAEAERAQFLETVREATSRETARDLRLLPPVELTYPRGLVQATMLMNYSRIPAFIPDYRHVLWPERYHNRMALFCFLFPGYPNEDYPFGWRGCDETLDPDPGLLRILDPRLKTAVLPLYRIGFAAAPAKPFSNHLKEWGPRYGWSMLAQTGNAAFVRTEAATLPGIARLTPDGSSDGMLRIRVHVEHAGAQVIILGGRRLERRATQAWLDGSPLEHGLGRGNWAVHAADLSEGPHLLELPSLEAGPDPEADYLYFAAVVGRDLAARYVALGDTADGATALRR